VGLFVVNVITIDHFAYCGPASNLLRYDMRRIKLLTLASIAVFAAIAAVPASQAQVTISIGAAPNCPYGYYDYAPYNCSPYGYYGPEWFSGGGFVGAGKWYHGPENFHGQVNNSYDQKHGYKGPVPKPEEKAESSKHPEKATNFKGNEEHDGHGHVTSGNANNGKH
jgi:hypothetical protein